MKKTWEGIRRVLNVSKNKQKCIDELVYKNKTFTESNDKANALNDFFVNIGTTIEAKIPTSKTSYSSYLKTPNTKSIFLKKCDITEVIDIVNNLQISKSCGPNSISTSLLKITIEILSPIITVLINMSFSEGLFHDLLKVANICPIYKNKRNIQM